MRSWQSPDNRKPPLVGVRVGMVGVRVGVPNDDEERPVRHVRRVRATGWALTGAERLSLLALSLSANPNVPDPCIRHQSGRTTDRPVSTLPEQREAESRQRSG